MFCKFNLWSSESVALKNPWKMLMRLILNSWQDHICIMLPSVCFASLLAASAALGVLVLLQACQGPVGINLSPEQQTLQIRRCYANCYIVTVCAYLDSWSWWVILAKTFGLNSSRQTSLWGAVKKNWKTCHPAVTTMFSVSAKQVWFSRRQPKPIPGPNFTSNGILKRLFIKVPV